MSNYGYGKKKGNRYEAKVAHQLSSWIFKEPNILWRDSTSGGRKVIYRGDIVPAKVHNFPWKNFPFLFEVKKGYKDSIPTIIKQTKLREWLSKLILELTEEQYIPILIAQYHFQPPILITTLMLNHYCDICLIQNVNERYYQFYIYDFNNLLKQEFNSIMPSEITFNIQHNIKKEEDYIDNKGIEKNNRKIINKKENEQIELGNIIGKIFSEENI